MTPELLYVIGWVSGVLGVLLLIYGLVLTIGSGKTGFLERGWKWFAGSGVLLIISATIPNPLARPEGGGVHLPVVWVWPAGWQVSVFVASVLAIYALLKVATLRHKSPKWWAVGAAFWILVAVFSYLWRGTDTGGQVFLGWITLGVQAIVGLVVIGVAALGAMAAAARWGVARKWMKVAVLHATLLAGVVVFGIPFLWLVITSFKEADDLVNEDGLVWIPKVREEAEFVDSRNPLFEVEWNDRQVEVAFVDAPFLETNGAPVVPTGSGSAMVEIERPFNLRGRRFEVDAQSLREIPRTGPVVRVEQAGSVLEGVVVRELDRGERLVRLRYPVEMEGDEIVAAPDEVAYIRNPGLRWQNYRETLEWMPESAAYGLVYLRNSLILVVMGVIGTVLSCSIVAYGFARLKFPGRQMAFGVMLATMMLPGAVTMLPSFLIFRWLGWIDTLYPLWVPAFFASAFNVFLLRQFFKNIPLELEHAAKVDGCSFLRTYWQIMMPQIKPALVVISIWTAIGAWNNFMGPLIYINSPDKMPIAYALQLFHTDKGGDFGLLMAGATMATLPVIVLFFVAQKYFIEGIQLTGFGGR